MNKNNRKQKTKGKTTRFSPLKQIHHKKFICYHLKHMTYVLYLEKQSMPMSERKKIYVMYNI